MCHADPEPATGATDTHLAEPITAANQSPSAVDAAAGRCTGTASERELQCSATYLCADHQDKATDPKFTGNTVQCYV